jgi:hypothetical protein
MSGIERVRSKIERLDWHAVESEKTHHYAAFRRAKREKTGTDAGQPEQMVWWRATEGDEPGMTDESMTGA